MKAIEDYINGNLTDAKEAAKRVSYRSLLLCLLQEYLKPYQVAIAIADYLKGFGTFQGACDAEAQYRRANR